MAEMRGLVAAGSKHTAQAGVEALRAGGNAVDAAVAACLATSAGEPPLTSLAGSGVLLHLDGGTDRVTICDFNANGPGLGAPPPDTRHLDFFPVELRFGPARQVFHIGRAAAAVPGALPGLVQCLQRWGRLSLEDVVRPACRMLRDGVVLDEFQGECFRLLEPIVLHSDPSRRLHTRRGRLLRSGDRFENPAVADTLERLAREGWDAFLRREWIPAILSSFGAEAGGRITLQDLQAYEVVLREPLHVRYRGNQVFLPPRPSAGGSLIALSLALLASEPIGRVERHGAGHLRRLLACMDVIEEARVEGGDPLAAEAVSRHRESFTGRLNRSGFTTHISVIDAAGNAAAVTLSHGEGNGYLLGNTGIAMNNMMGEADIHPEGFHTWPPGHRLYSMMSPTLLRGEDGTVTVLGTGGSSRIRTSILQVISNLTDFGMEPEEAVRAGRVHRETGVVNAEVFDLPDGRSALDAVAGDGEELIEFAQPHMFFGGVHTARRCPDGRLLGGGDRRRGGVVLTA